MLISQNQKGMSIVEVIVALLIASVVIVAALTLFSNSMTTSQRVLDQGKLDRDLNAAMDAMVLDLKRAGYWGTATNSNTNPFMATGLDITTNSDGTCVTFTYDKNNDGTVATVSAAADDEHYGFRKNGAALQYRPPGATTDCSAASTNWDNLTDTNILTITAFNVTTTNTALAINGTTNTTQMRKVTISVTGYLNNDVSNAKTITRTIRVNNNKYIP
ncbi:MAG: hypothetical protein COY58_03470 [Gammaproteobacteria bacterium CG_4_10_14_0_8_um_filter_38_16]|nr:MAG: hypothetical protein COY58_03470 [Gammaproteobacteria bacterium CG_4_10_14_0_8_um_filter_38_16]PJA03642.1 MAG: hypothetical protein COX72_03855 [Gammaproteobacteria bacterium CG_4_10_14_0_2_um_filter_38_22]PJB11308.1 MAG: hypothetical protein CO120_00660 [Gammaproteobacteria bacterium CG_4_9_14_3_um_filter_38_9]